MSKLEDFGSQAQPKEPAVSYREIHSVAGQRFTILKTSYGPAFHNNTPSSQKCYCLFRTLMGPLMSTKAMFSGKTSPFCNISTSPRSRLSQTFRRISGIRSFRSEAPLSCSSAAVRARATSEGQIVLGYRRVDSSRSRWCSMMLAHPAEADDNEVIDVCNMRSIDGFKHADCPAQDV